MSRYEDVILALETATRPGSVAVLRNGEVLASAVGLASRSHGERLPGEIVRLLASQHLGVHDVTRFAVVVGPGSFTGLRVGIATIQGLALVQSTPVVGVSTLAALGQAAGTETPVDIVGAWLDGQRQQVFTAAYARSTSASVARPDGCEAGSPTISVPAGWHALTSHEVGAPADIARSWSSTFTGRTVTFIGDGAVKYAAELRAAFGLRLLGIAAPPALAPLVGLLAGRATPGQFLRPQGIQPLYVRRPDVDLARARRSTVRWEAT